MIIRVRSRSSGDSALSAPAPAAIDTGQTSGQLT
jgi:hypothetical protein